MSLRNSTQSGFVLVNALIIVAALSAAAVFLLQRSETARQRLALSQEVAQAELYLDAFEQLVRLLLDADAADNSRDHLNERWNVANYTVPIGRGALEGQITDLQGRFNVNWLSDPEDAAARIAFDRLIQRLGLSAQLSSNVAGFVEAHSGSTAPARIPVGGTAPGVAPILMAARGGPLMTIDQLRHLPGMQAEMMAKLEPHLTALPADSKLNVNTATFAVLMAFLPEDNAAAIQQAIAIRAVTPFGSGEDYLGALENQLTPEMLAAVDLSRLTGRSQWFIADIRAGLDQTRLGRQVVFKRRMSDRAARVAWRINRNGW